jgi:hypothetical protein
LINIHRSREANEDRFTTFTYQANQIKTVGKTFVGGKPTKVKAPEQPTADTGTARVEKKDEKQLIDRSEHQELIEMEKLNDSLNLESDP